MDLASHLKDIQLPSPVSIWPLAIGWYVLLAILLAAVVAGFFYWRRRKSRQRLPAAFTQEIIKLRHQAQSQLVIDELAVLLKRAALLAYPREQVASLYGEQWLQFLDETCGEQLFTQGPGRLLLSAYQPHQYVNQEPIIYLVEKWIKRHV